MPWPSATAEIDERRFLRLFTLVALGFGGRMALVAFNGPLVGKYTDNGYLIGLLLAAGPIVAALMNPAVGRFSDRTWTRWGRRLPYARLAVPISIVLVLLVPHAPGIGTLLALFLLRAMLGSLAGVPLMSLIPDAVSSTRRGQTMSHFMIAAGVSALVIQGSGKLLWDENFAWVFYLTGALTLIAVPPLFLMREPPPAPGEIEAARSREGISWSVIRASLTRGDPIALFLASASLRYTAVGMVTTYLTLFTVTDLGISVGDTALALGLTGALTLVLAIPAGQIADRFNRRNLLLGATAASAGIQLATGFWVSDLGSLYVVMGIGATIGTISMVAGGPLFMDLLPAQRRGELTGINMVLQNLFTAGGVLVGGAIFAQTGSYQLCFAAGAIALVLATVLLARVPYQAPAVAPDAGAAEANSRA